MDETQRILLAALGEFNLASIRMIHSELKCRGFKNIEFERHGSLTKKKG